MRHENNKDKRIDLKTLEELRELNVLVFYAA